tara:strand:- start:20882 stop:22201 length:1320 start_codon:yes stop_codon:yes gene_type:complete
MCGIYFTNQDKDTSFDKKFLERGPNFFKKESYKSFEMGHSLLSLTGEFTPQPIQDMNTKLIFNGQIYNYDNFKFSSDSFFILDEYLKDKSNFWKNLDGEYAIVIHDMNINKIIFLTDIFGTKPLYFSINKKNISISSLRSTLEINGHKEINKCKPNTIYEFDLSKNELILIENYFEFNLDQYKNTFEDWHNLFLDSIKKRFKNLNHDIILPLSSGHDSGAIASAMEILDIDFYSYSFLRNEHRKVISKRILKRFLKNPFKTQFKRNLQDMKLRSNLADHLNNNCDKFFYGAELNLLDINGFDDPGAIGLTHVLKSVQKSNNNIKIVASGQGGDEIYSNNQNYTFDKSNPKYFDSYLKKIFPWQNFFYGTQISYLSKEESIGGSFGMETRYPFLDKKLVQEYLNLTPDLKNKYYKSPITDFLIKTGYPFIDNNTKVGFNP